MRHVVGHREDGDKSVNEHDICVVSRFNVPPPLWSGTMDSPMEEQHPTAIVERLSTRVEAMDDPENRHGCHGRQEGEGGPVWLADHSGCNGRGGGGLREPRENENGIWRPEPVSQNACSGDPT
jgi:hypothetical protein